MPTPFLAQDIEAEEGRRNQAYPDPLTGGEPWTVGVGFTGPEIGPKTYMTDAQIDAEMIRRLGALEDNLDRSLPWWRSLDPVRQDVFCQMGWQMGVSGLLQFKVTLSEIKAGDYATAALGMLQSTWAKQTPARAHRLAEQMKTGVRQEPN